MPLDTSIYNSLLRPAKSVAEYDAEAVQGQQNKLALQMGQTKMADYQRERADEQQMRGVVSQFGADKTANYNALLGAGRLKEAQAYEKSNAELGKTVAETGYQTAQTGKVKADVASKSHEAIGQTLGALSAIPSGATPEHVQRAMAHLVDIGMVAPEMAEKIIAGAPQDPAQMKQWLITGRNAVMSAKDQRSYTDVDANTAANNKTSIATNAATNATSRANNAATVAASMANAGATRQVADATRDAARIQRDQATEMKLADDYRNQSKAFKEVGDAYKQISATLDKATTSPAATLAAATKFMKLLDPGSVVRESELGMALAATGAVDRLTNYTNTLKYGKVLTANQAEDFRNITKQIYAAAQAQQQQIDGNYRRQAETYKLRPEVIIQDMGQSAPAGGAGAPTGVPSDISALLSKHGGKK